MSKSGIVDELHKPARRNYPRRYVTIKGLNDLFQGDIVEMRPYAAENEGNNYLLTIIDTFTKKAWAVPMKTKTATEVAEALKSILDTLKETPKFLQTDQGGEFFNGPVSRLLNKHNIKLYASFSPLKASIIERFNRTLKTWMWKEFSLQGNYKWIHKLKELLKKYNSRIHRTTGFAPSKVNKRNEAIIVGRLLRKKLPPKKKNKFKVGDSVRISKYKHIFEKGYTPNWTTEVFVIDQVQNTRPVTYKLRDYQKHPIQGGFYEEELQKTNFKDTYLVEKILEKRGNKVLVKWLGFDDSHNQWIKAKEIEE